MNIYTSILLFFFTYSTFSQTVIKGIVCSEEDKLPLPGVNITEIGTSNTTITDFDGNFTIKSKTNKFRFEYIGLITKEIIIRNNEKKTIFLKEDTSFIEIYPSHRNLWFTVGAYSDIINAPIGFTIGNGFEEEQHIHFEDHTHKFTYEFYFAKEIDSSNKTYGGKISLTNVARLGINLKGKSSFFDPTIEFNIKDYSNVQIKDLSFLSNIVYSKFLHSSFYTKIGYQKLNRNENKGFAIGINRRKYEKYNFGIDVGYWNDYFSYNTYISRFIYKKQIMTTINYQRIDDYNFFNMKINYLFNTRKKIKRK